MSRILVTGAGGYLGSHLAEALAKQGDEVTAMVHYRSDGSHGQLAYSSLREHMEIMAGDIRNVDAMMDLFTRRFDTVYHLAALISIPYSYKASREFVDTNVLGTLNILQAAVKNGSPLVVHTSTSEVYGSGDGSPMNELRPLRPQSPYAASKMGADALATAFHHSYNLPVITLRPFNSFGPRQSQRALIPSVILQALAGKDVKIAHPASRRDWTYVKDTVDAFLLAGKSDKAIGQVINVGSGFTWSVEETGQQVIAMVNPKLSLIVDANRERPVRSEVSFLCADWDNAKRLLGWQPRHTRMEGLLDTISWFSANQGSYHRHGEFVV